MNKLKLYITYPNGLDEVDEKMTSQLWTFSNRLSSILKKMLGYEAEIMLKGKDFNVDQSNEFLKQSTHVLFFIHPSFTDNAEYLEELEDARVHLGLSHVDHVYGFDKMYKVSLAPLKSPLESGAIETLFSYDLFTRNTFTRKIKSLDFADSESSSSVYAKLLDLSYDIKTSLIDKEKVFAVENENEKTVYLGLTTFDQHEARDEIRRELQHLGYRVLPSINMPVDGEMFREILLENLSRCNTVVQLMGSNYGDLLRGTKNSLPDYQNLVIREYQQQADRNIFKRFIWLPQKLKISDQRQSLYLKRLRRDDADINTEIIEIPIETFKTILSARLSLGKSVIKEDKLGNLSKVYLISEEEPSEGYQKLYNALSLSGLKVYSLDYDEQAGIYARHLQALKESDGVIIYQQKSNAFWLDSKIRDIIKAPGIGRKNPFKKIIISTSLNPDKFLVKMIQSNVEIIKQVGIMPEDILQKLISE